METVVVEVETFEVALEPGIPRNLHKVTVNCGLRTWVEVWPDSDLASFLRGIEAAAGLLGTDVKVERRKRVMRLT